MSEDRPRRRFRPGPGFGRRLLRGFLLLLVPPAALGVAAYVYVTGGRYVVTENAYVKADIVAVSADVSGRVIWVGIGDNQAVEKGQPLFQIDPVPFEIAVAEAEAEMAMVRSQIASFRADYRLALAELAEADERVRFLELQYERQERLRAKGVGTEEKYDRAHHDLATARQRVRAIGERIHKVLASLGGDAEIPVRRHARYLRAKAKRDKAALDLEDAAVLAPSAGVISNMKLQVGEYVGAGTPIFSLIEAATVWVQANLKETQLTHVTEGQTATVVLDAYPDRVLAARIESISPATGAEFALLPPQNASGNWVKVVQRVPVRLAIEPGAATPPLRAGMTATVSIDTERQRDVRALVRAALAWSGRGE